MPGSASAEVGAGGRFRPRRQVRLEEVALIPAINGRAVIGRADMAARGIPPGTVTGWYRDRARTGHPEKAGRIGRTDYWYEDEWAAWYEAHLRDKVESLTEVDRQGDPDDLVDAAEAARMLRYANRYVIHANRRLGYFPAPDAYGRATRGRQAPLWKRSTVWAAADSRQGMGGGHRVGHQSAYSRAHHPRREGTFRRLTVCSASDSRWRPVDTDKKC
jgi:hypothetical protein